MNLDARDERTAESWALARSFRYYGKKRGNRRTGSPLLGSVGEALFWAVLLLLGCGGAIVLLLNFVLPEWRVNHEFVPTTCKVLDKRIAERQGEDGPLFRPEIKIEYEVGSETYRGWHYDIHHHEIGGGYSGGRENAQAVLNQFARYDRAKETRYPCWYDPGNPYVAVLVRGYRWWIWLAFTVPASFVVIGAGGLLYTLWHWGKSAEHRAAMTQRAQERDFFGASGNDPCPYPFVPQGADMTNSPGTRLKFRLPMAKSPGWALLGTLALCVILNAVSVFAVIAIRRHLADRPDWFLTLCIVPCVLIGLGAIGIFLRQLLVTAGIGPTLVEISGHPLQPGREYRLFLSQSGRLTINSMSVWLVCAETATYRQGTNTRTETQEVHRQELFCRQQFQIERGLRFETEIEFRVPEGAMHSFKADHNEINWAVAVEGDVVGWPRYKRSFPVIVRPANGEIDP
jgi:hypothetical protein